MLRLSDRSVGEEIRNLYMNLSKGYRRVTEDKLLIFSQMHNQIQPVAVTKTLFQ